MEYKIENICTLVHIYQLTTTPTSSTFALSLLFIRKQNTHNHQQKANKENHWSSFYSASTKNIRFKPTLNSSTRTRHQQKPYNNYKHRNTNNNKIDLAQRKISFHLIGFSICLFFSSHFQSVVFVYVYFKYSTND